MTANKPIIESAATIVPVRDVGVSIVFYRVLLGFDMPYLAPDNSIAIVKREGAVIQLLQTDDAETFNVTATNIAIYLSVKQIDALYASLEPGLMSLPETRLRPPFNQDYGMREFHIKDPDGCLLFFGEDVTPEA